MQTRYSLSNDRTVLGITVLAFFIPSLFYFGILLPFRQSMSAVGITAGSVAVFSLLFVLSAWGLAKDRVHLDIGRKKVFLAILLSIGGWAIYAGLQLAFSMDSLSNIGLTLGKLAAWPRVLGWVCTWLFTGFAEELLFRGYFLAKIKHILGQMGNKRPMMIAAVLANAIFALWHIPNRAYQVITGQLSLGMAILSLAVVFVMAAGFTYLYVRSQNILLVGMVHGLVDLPIVGDQNYASALILIVIGLFEVLLLIDKRRQKVKSTQLSSISI